MEIKNIYLIEDDSFFALNFIKKLKQIDNYSIHHFASCELAFERIKEDKPQIIFLDHLLGGINGVDAIPTFQEMNPGCDIVIVSGQQDIEVMKTALDQGAAKYFSKDALIMQNTTGFLKEIVDRPAINEGFWRSFFNSYSSAISDVK